MRIHYRRQRCSPRSVVSGDISFMPIFVMVRWCGGVKWECGRRKCEFSLSIAIVFRMTFPTSCFTYRIYTASRCFTATARLLFIVILPWRLMKAINVLDTCRRCWTRCSTLCRCTWHRAGWCLQDSLRLSRCRCIPAYTGEHHWRCT